MLGFWVSLRIDSFFANQSVRRLRGVKNETPRNMGQIGEEIPVTAKLKNRNTANEILKLAGVPKI